MKSLDTDFAWITNNYNELQFICYTILLYKLLDDMSKQYIFIQLEYLPFYNKISSYKITVSLIHVEIKVREGLIPLKYFPTLFGDCIHEACQISC